VRVSHVDCHAGHRLRLGECCRQCFVEPAGCSADQYDIGGGHLDSGVSDDRGDHNLGADHFGGADYGAADLVFDR
jgi:hypothetical protein